MTDDQMQDKRKNDERTDSDKTYETEWSFSFERLGEQFNKLLGSVSGDEQVEVSSFVTPLDGATFAAITLGPSVGRHTLAALPAGSPNLLEAEVAHVGSVEFKAEGGAEREVVLRQQTGRPRGLANLRQTARAAADREELRWQMALSPEIPLQLKIGSGVGSCDFDLSGLQINGLTLNTGVGEVVTTLPGQDTPYAVSANTGVGATHFRLPDATTLSLKISAGVGEVAIEAPETVALRVQVSGGLGSAHLPEPLQRVSGRSEAVGYKGVWETEGFAVAERQITIDYSGGLGAFRVRFA